MKRLTFFLSSLILGLVAFNSCEKDPDVQDNTLVPIELTKAEQEISDKIGSFGLDLFKEVYSAQDQMLSPMSVSLALAMADYGAEGSTHEQISKALGLDGFSSEEVAAYYDKMLEALVKIDKNTVLSSANAVWVSKAFPVLDSYKTGVSKYFHAESNNVDFSDAATVKDINKWVSDKTFGKISSILNGIPTGTQMIMANALYFQSLWADPKNPFVLSKEKMAFKDIDGADQQFTAMTREFAAGLYAYDDTFEMLTIPYGNNAFCMDILLPVPGVAFEDAVASLDNAEFSKLNKKRFPYRVDLTMPVFKFESSLGLVDALKNLGIVKPFEDGADFTGISSSSMSLSDVLHKTTIDVNEKGTVAAAVTAITGDGAFRSPYEVDFIVDHPFIFIIREQSNGTILFIGQKVR